MNVLISVDIVIITKVIISHITIKYMPLSKAVAFGGSDFLTPRQVTDLPDSLTERQKSNDDLVAKNHIISSYHSYSL